MDHNETAARGRAAVKKTTGARGTHSVPPADTLAQQLHRRRAASYRLLPLPCGHRDPLDCARPPEPSTTELLRFHYTEEQLRAFANQLAAAGWQLWEIVDVLGVTPREHCPCCHHHQQHQHEQQQEAA